MAKPIHQLHDGASVAGPIGADRDERFAVHQARIVGAVAS
jgi:hypothetical protein